MDVVVLAGTVVLGAGAEVGVRHDPELLEEVERAIDGGCVDAGEALTDTLRHGLGRDVTRDAHDLPHDRPSLRRHAVALPFEGGEDLVGVALGHETRLDAVTRRSPPGRIQAAAGMADIEGTFVGTRELAEMARIYVVDDNADVRHVVIYALAELGHEIAMYRDGETALEAILADPPQLLILDLMMPGYDGFEILEQMGSWGVQGATRTLVLSARTSDEDRARALHLGADLFMTKPFDPEELVDATRELMSLSSEGLQQWRASASGDVAELLAGR